jgi:hypothetical protein
MNEFNQIRERFLADTRKHFFADEAPASKLHAAARQTHNQCRCTAQQPCGNAGA